MKRMVCCHAVFISICFFYATRLSIVVLPMMFGFGQKPISRIEHGLAQTQKLQDKHAVPPEIDHNTQPVSQALPAPTSESVQLYVTLWTHQVTDWGLDRDASYIHWLGSLADARVNIIMLSAEWRTIEKSRDVFVFTETDRLVGIAKDMHFKLMVVLSTAAPEWALQEFAGARTLGGGPQGSACNAKNNMYLSDLDPGASQRTHVFFMATVRHLVETFGAETFLSFQPTWNNELETKVTQHCDVFWDYSQPTQVAYARWLLEQNPDRTYWHRRWFSSHPSDLQDQQYAPFPFSNASLPSLQPPRVWGKYPNGKSSFVGADRLAYWDWMRFRVIALAKTHTGACQTISAAGGLGCFLHFGEWFSSIDAIYANPFYELASSPLITDVVLDSNFRNFNMKRVLPVSGAMMVSSAQFYRTKHKKRIWFETAFERLSAGSDSDGSDVQLGISGAFNAGVDGFGATNIQPRDIPAIPGLFPTGQLVRGWSPKAILFLAYEVFFSFRRWGNGSVDIMQDLAHRAYDELVKECGCQVAVVGDIMHVNIEELGGYDTLVWQQVPGVLPSYVRNRMSILLQTNLRWRVQQLPQWIREQGFHQIVAPVMGRTSVTALPDFIIGGPPKAASSTLFDWVSGYQQVAPSKQKEINYFDRNFHRGLGWYTGFFRQSFDLSLNAEDWPLVFEATPGYMYHPSVPGRMARLLPYVRLIFIIRNPIERAWSDYKMWVRQKITGRYFDDMVADCIAEIDRVPDAVERGLVYRSALRENCRPVGNEVPTELTGECLCKCYENIVAKGLYYEQVGRWRQYFPRQQILLLQMEQFAKPRRVLQHIETYLDLSPLHPEAYARLVPVNTESAPINKVFKPSDKLNMSVNASIMLHSFYHRAPIVRFRNS